MVAFGSGDILIMCFGSLDGFGAVRLIEEGGSVNIGKIHDRFVSGYFFFSPCLTYFSPRASPQYIILFFFRFFDVLDTVAFPGLSLFVTLPSPPKWPFSCVLWFSCSF